MGMQPVPAQVNQSTQPLTSNSGILGDDSPVTRRFNTYKEKRPDNQTTHSMLNQSSVSIRHVHQGSSSSVHSSTLPSDFGQMVCDGTDSAELNTS